MKIEITETETAFTQSGYVERPNGNAITLTVSGDDADRFRALANDILAARLADSVAESAQRKAEWEERQKRASATLAAT